MYTYTHTMTNIHKHVRMYTQNKYQFFGFKLYSNKTHEDFE